MNDQVCRSLLAGWTAPDAEQDRLRRRYLDHLDATPDAWSRSSPVAHLTASAMIMDPTGTRVCLVLHGKLGRWLQTGGHLEADDVSLPAAAAREAAEESGLRVEVDPVPVLLSEHPAPCRPDCAHLDVQFLARAAVTPPTVSAESRAVAWFDVDELPATDDTVRSLVAAAVRRVRSA